VADAIEHNEKDRLRLFRKKEVAIEKVTEKALANEGRGRHIDLRLEECGEQLDELDEKISRFNGANHQPPANQHQLGQDEEGRHSFQVNALETPDHPLSEEERALLEHREAVGSEFERYQREREVIYERQMAIERELRQAKKRFAKQKNGLEIDRIALRDQLHALHEKINCYEQRRPAPFLIVGKHLVDLGISSQQETHLLPGLLALRKEAERLTGEITLLRQATLAENRAEKFLFFAIVYGLAVGGISALLALGMHFYVQAGQVELPAGISLQPETLATQENVPTDSQQRTENNGNELEAEGSSAADSALLFDMDHEEPVEHQAVDE